MFSSLSIINYGNHKYKFIIQPIKFKNNKSSLKDFWKNEYKDLNNEKLINNIIRARSKIYDLCKCNDFYFFVTCTINSEHNRKDLKWLIKETSQIVRNLRVKYKSDFKYLLVPEQHKDGAWHLHGLLSEDFKYDFYINKNKYLSWNNYDKIGFTNISIINDYDACIDYITKYIDKSFSDRKKGERLYFRSNNLNEPIKEKTYILRNTDNIYVDYENEFCKLIYINNEFEYNNIINNIKEKIYNIIENNCTK